jgi:hypothetical protein
MAGLVTAAGISASVAISREADYACCRMALSTAEGRSHGLQAGEIVNEER